MDQLLLRLVEPPVLAYPEDNKEFLTNADASGKGLGAALLQYPEGGVRVISYDSRTLTPAEKKYTALNLNFWESNVLYVTNLEITFIRHHTSIFTQTITLLNILCLQEGSQQLVQDG